MVNTNHIEAAFGLTQASETPRIKGVFACHDMGRSTQTGDLLIDSKHNVWLVDEQDLKPIDRVLQLIQGRQANDITGYRVLLKNF